MFKQMISLIAVAGLVLALAGSAQAATVTWTGEVDDKWSTVTGGTSGFGNWDADPTTGGHQLNLNTDSTSILDFDTDTWAQSGVIVGENHTLVLATGGVLTSTGYSSQWSGTVKFEGGTIGSPWAVFAGPILRDNGILEFHGGTFEDGTNGSDPPYIYFRSGLIHVVGKDGGNFNPAYFRHAYTNKSSFQFTLVAGEGVETIALSSTGQAFRNEDDKNKSDLSGKFALTVDGIQDYLDAGGTQSEWVLMTSAQADPDATDDLTLVQTGLVDGGLGTVTATHNTVTLTITAGPAAPFAITAIDYDPDADTVTLTWRSRPGTLYKAFSSPDLSDWSNELADSLGPATGGIIVDGNLLTMSFPLTGQDAAATDLFFRIQEQ